MNSDLAKLLNPLKAVILFVAVLILMGSAKSQTTSADSSSKFKRLAEKIFQLNSRPVKKLKFSMLPLFSPPAYKVFENDPMSLFSKTGARVSANIQYNPKAEEKDYSQQHVLSANYGFIRTGFNVGYVGNFYHLLGPVDLVLKTRLDAPSVENYFGTGNETEKTRSSRTFYRTYSTRFYGGVGFDVAAGSFNSFDVSVFYQYVKMQQRGGYLLSEVELPDSSVFSGNQFGGIEGSYHFHRVNNNVFPTAGVDFLLAADYLQNLEKTNRSFTNVASALSVYIPLGRSFSIASRAGAAALLGDADIYHLNKLGGFVNLRGYDRERFYGKTIFYNNNELRWITSVKNNFYDGKVGLLAFYDDGRVWQPLERSDKWHTGYGAGLILIPFNKIALTGTYCNSADGNFIQLKAGMFF